MMGGASLLPDQLVCLNSVTLLFLAKQIVDAILWLLALVYRANHEVRGRPVAWMIDWLLSERGVQCV